MRHCFTILIFLTSITGVAQFKHSEFYAVTRFAFGMGMNSYTYRSELEGNMVDIPRAIQIELGKGLIPEIGLGFKLTKNVYVETSISYSRTSNFYTTKGVNGINEQGYSFNRYAIQLNGKYFVPVTEKFLLGFNGGGSFSMPKELVVKMSGYIESIKYAGSNGLQAGFTGNYILGIVSFSGGIRYRLERFTIKPHQDLPNNFKAINPNFNKINSSGIDLVFSVLFHF